MEIFIKKSSLLRYNLHTEKSFLGVEFYEFRQIYTLIQPPSRLPQKIPSRRRDQDGSTGRL